MSRVASRFLILTVAASLAGGWMTARPSPVQAISPDVVISEVYGGGGNTGAPYNQDFVELHNRSAVTVSLAGWSVQYASATGTGTFAMNSPVALSGSIAPGGKSLVALASGATGVALPTPDATGTINMSATAGKVIVANTGTGLACNGGSDPCDAAETALIRDLVGYGGANFFETSPAPAASNTTSVSRAGGGATDTDNNSADFTAGSPTPQNSGLKLSINDVSQPEGQSGSGLMDFTVSLSAAAGAGGVTFDIATQNDSATTADGDYIASSLTGQSIPEGSSSYRFSVIVNGDTKVESNEQFFVNVSNIGGATSADGQGVGTLTNDDSNPCDETFTPIYAIQGSGSSAAIPVGTTVTTEGVVVGDFEGTAANSGFFVQDATGDGIAATSDGIFVLSGSGNLASAGQAVRITGVVREPNGLTALTGGAIAIPITATNVVDCGTGAVNPTDVSMPFASTTFPERYEGMLVRFPQQLVIAEYFNFERFGEIVLALPLAGESRPFTGTVVDEPGAAANARTQANLVRRITLDDNQSASNPAVLRHPNGDAFSLANRFRGADQVQNAVGVLGFAFGLYRIHPTEPAGYTSVNPRPEQEAVGGSLKVAAMNTLNFFLTVDTTDSDSGPGPCGGNANLDCRGADDDVPNSPDVDDELTRQRTKLIEALAAIDADVLGLNELENTPDVDPLGGPGGIVEGLNDKLGAGMYAASDAGTIGTDAIKVGLIYKPGVVTPIGDFEILDSTDDPRFADNRSRPALAQTFEQNATGARFTVVVNHLKSKGESGLAPSSGPPGICNDADPTNNTLDCDQGDGQSFWNFTRLQAARALVDWIATDPTGSGDPDFLIIGDLNSYAMEDPIDAIKAGEDDTPDTDDDWTNIIAQFVEGLPYSFVFDGQSGYLGHGRANASIAGQVTGATEWHINADEPDLLDYDVTFKPAAQELIYEPNEFRTSDHDPLIVGLDLVNEAPTIAVSAGSSCAPIGLGGTFQLTVDDNEVAAGDLVVSLVGDSNPTLVPSVAFGGSGATRTAAITVAAGQSGNAVVTIGVNDGFQTTTTTISVRVGTAADDTFVGGAGADLLLGLQGSDSLSGGSGADVLCGGQSVDSLAGGDGNDALGGERGVDSLSGDEGNDLLVGGQGGDSLAGGAGDDTLTGNAGPDFFSGGPGTDTNTDVTPSQGDTWDGT